jgi:anthranilate phosphoribosyltransferase
VKKVGLSVAHIDAHGGWAAVLNTLSAGEDLTSQEARAALMTVLDGEATDAQIAGFIIALRMKGECVEEITGLVEAMLENAAPLELPPDVIDIVGTGGAPSRRHAALSVSTMACFVAAGAGARVAKHGNVKASATSGAFDTLDALGVSVGLDGPGVVRCVEEVGCGFVFARAFHPALRHAGPVRAQLGVPTVFNILGPMAHPGKVTRQVVGVSDPALQDLIAGVFAARGSTHALIVHGTDKLDEFTLTGPTRVVEVRDGEIVSTSEFEPDSVGLSTVDAAELTGGSPEDNAAIAHAIFSGEERGPRCDIVALNAAAGLIVAGVVDNMGDGLTAARESIDSGRAAEVLAAVVELSALIAS